MSDDYEMGGSDPPEQVAQFEAYLGTKLDYDKTDQ